MNVQILDGLELPAALDVQVCWALIGHGQQAIPKYTLHRFTNTPDEAVSWPVDLREDALRHVEPRALHVHRALNDSTDLVDIWLEVPEPMRELLLTDRSFRETARADSPAD